MPPGLIDSNQQVAASQATDGNSNNSNESDPSQAVDQAQKTADAVESQHIAQNEVHAKEEIAASEVGSVPGQGQASAPADSADTSSTPSVIDPATMHAM